MDAAAPGLREALRCVLGERGRPVNMREQSSAMARRVRGDRPRSAMEALHGITAGQWRQVEEMTAGVELMERFAERLGKAIRIEDLRESRT